VLTLCSVTEVLKDINEEATCYIVKAREKKNCVEEQITGILVVEEYVDVFRDDV